MKTCKDFTEGIYKSLNNVVQMLKRPDVQSVEALCIRLTSDVNAGRMLYRLLYWFPKSVKQTGEVYKSWRDWDAELCLTRDQVARVHREGFLEAVGILRRQRQTAKGNPVHYLLDVERFLMVLAEFADVSITLLNVWLDSKPSTEKTESASGESQQAITTNTFPTENLYNNIDSKNNRADSSNEDVVVSAKLFKIPEIKTPVLIELVRQYGLERVQAMYKYAKRKNPRNLGGFIRQGLVENWEIEASVPPETEKMTWAQFAHSSDDSDVVIEMEYAQTDSAFSTTQMETIREVVSPHLETPIVDRPSFNTPMDIWLAAMQQLELQLDRASFDTWVKRAKLVDYVDGTWVIECHNAMARDMLQHRFYRTIWRLLTDFSGIEATLEFEYYPTEENQQNPFLRDEGNNPAWRESH